MSPRTVALWRAVRRPLLDVGWSSVGLSASKALALVATVVITRNVPPEEFGAFVVASTAAILLVPLLDAGFSTLVFRLASVDPPEQGLSLVAAAGAARRALWGAALVVAGVTSAVVPDRIALLVLLTAASAIAHTYLETATLDLLGRGRHALGAAIRIGSGATAVVGALALVSWMPTATAALASFAAARVIPAGCIAVIARRRRRPRPDLHWRHALPLGLVGVMVVLYVRSDIVLLSAYKVDPSDVAVYGIAYNILFTLQLFPVAVTAATFRRLARGGQHEGAMHVTSVAAAMSFMAVAVVALFALAPHVFGIFGGHYRRNYATVLPLVASILPITAGMLGVTALQARGGERLVLRVVAAALGINVALNLALIPLLGIRGSVVATLVTEVALALSSLRACRRVGLPDLSGVAALALVPVLAAALFVTHPAAVAAALPLCVGTLALAAIRWRPA